MYIKVAVIGATQANTEEIKNVVAETIGGDDIVTFTLHDDYEAAQDADLYVCLINRKAQMEEAFGAHRVLAMEFVPPTEYFLKLSQLPAGTKVAIFNNSTAGTNVLMGLLKKYELTYLDYTVIPYDEWPEERILETLSQFDYITGSKPYVGPGSELYTRYGSALRENVMVLASPQRIATAASLSRLSSEFATLCHQRLTVELERLASTDYLTGISNRRIFDETMAAEWERAIRDKTPLSVAILDIDCFKNYNDCYGHVAGDECLVRIADAIRNNLKRPADFCARYGGEEFSIIMPNTESRGAMLVVDGIRQAVGELQISNESSVLAKFVTVSGGVTTGFPSKKTMASMTLQEFFQRADKALYQAKSEGKNKVVAFPPVPLKQTL